MKLCDLVSLQVMSGTISRSVSLLSPDTDLGKLSAFPPHVRLIAHCTISG